MDTTGLLEILGIFLLSSIKFGIAGVPAAVFAKFSLFKTLTVTISGGVAGTIFFTYLSEWVILGIAKLRARLFGPPKPKRKFTRMNRLIVTVKRKFGLIGLAIITPSLLSIPLGVFLAVRYYPNKQKIILYMCISIVCWAVVLYFFYHYFYSMIF